jgi:hypothetical protein
MASAVIHRMWAREFLVRAQEAPNRNRKVKYLQLAVSNSVRARRLEGDSEETSAGAKNVSNARTR